MSFTVHLIHKHLSWIVITCIASLSAQRMVGTSYAAERDGQRKSETAEAAASNS